METTIVIPTRDESESIEQTLRTILGLRLRDFEVVVVDGASINGTVQIVENFPVRLIRQEPTQLGKGNGLRLAFAKARGRKVIWVDADATYPLLVIPRIVKELDRFDVVAYSRKFGKENMPKFNRFGNWLFKVLIKGLHGFKGNDPCTGLWGVHRRHLARMKLTSERFAIEPEIAIKAGRMKLKTLDVPIRYQPRLGKSKLNPIKVGFEDLWTIVKLIGWKPE